MEINSLGNYTLYKLPIRPNYILYVKFHGKCTFPPLFGLTRRAARKRLAGRKRPAGRRLPGTGVSDILIHFGAIQELECNGCTGLQISTVQCFESVWSNVICITKEWGCQIPRIWCYMTVHWPIILFRYFSKIFAVCTSCCSDWPS